MPQLGTELTWQLAKGVAYLRRDLVLRKNPSIAESLDWANSLLCFNADRFTEQLVEQTINVLLKDEDDYLEFEEKGGAKRMLQAMTGEEKPGAVCSCGHHSIPIIILEVFMENYLENHIVNFAHILRSAVKVVTSEILDALRALPYIELEKAAI